MRRATVEDIPRIVDMGRAFHSYSPWRHVPFDPHATGDFAASIIRNGVIFLTEDGMCGGCITPFYFSPDYKLGVEMFWWAPKHGRELRKAFEAWAQENGATAVQFSALSDNRSEAVNAVYTRAGFERAETAYIKRF